MKTTSALLLALVIIAQLAALASMIQSKERILRSGEAFRFKTRPIDPADPFQGRYVSLGFEADHIPIEHVQADGLRVHETIYATLESDAEGYARFSGWSRERPTTGAFLKTRYLGNHTRWDQGGQRSISKGLNIEIPFNRFYMDEAKAPRAEQAARDATRSTNCWAAVRILGGKAVVEDVFVKGLSLRDLAAQKK
jgi:uncharacterized membrane-anchored protein